MSLSISIILLNYNGIDLTRDCIDSLLQSDYPTFNIILVDNGSENNEAAQLQAEYPQVTHLPQETNLGFCPSNNIGIRHALQNNADLILLLNNDTLLSPDTLSTLVRAAQDHPEDALFAPKIYYEDPRDLIWYAGGDIAFHKVAGAIHRGYKQPDTPHDQNHRISFITGCAFLIRAEALQTIGLLDEPLFFYCEDLDWSIKAHRAGLTARYVPDAHIWHRVGAVFGEVNSNPRKIYLRTRNRFIIQRRYTSLLKTIGLIPLYLVGHIARDAYRATLTPNPNALRALITGIHHGITQNTDTIPF